MSSVDIVVSPIARQCSFPSAMIATVVPLSTGFMKAPGDVRPGHMMLAPLSTKRIAPLSTCCLGRNLKKQLISILRNFRTNLHGKLVIKPQCWHPLTFSEAEE